ncbi:hypothetical protein GALL_227500 [mine drainage metagenome]|uniref:Uracil DNA glycosylase superfamily protein n=1 Tax=mine drainage metagenome TaxID=410659 RepID=A0A1J5RTH2_9ZZZZ
MSLMTREDMLRELELLPIWSLRNPLPSPLLQVEEVNTQEAPPSEPVLAAVEVVNEVLKEVSLESAWPEALPELAPVMPAPVADVQVLVSPVSELQVFRHVTSEDGDWLFVLSNTEPTEDEALLLRNIFMAMGIRSKSQDAPAITLDLLQALQPKLVVAMGEVVAQHLLHSAESLANLRGTAHVLESIALVVTYDVAHLLQARADKANAWADLCLAMQTLQRLKSVN